jgi:hypothetical protein
MRVVATFSMWIPGAAILGRGPFGAHGVLRRRDLDQVV